MSDTPQHPQGDPHHPVALLDHPPVHDRRDPSVQSGGDHPVQLTTVLDQQERDHAAGTSVPCRVEDPELWFPETPQDVEFAKTLCQTCPVRVACLTSALQRAEPWGVWGGEIFERGAVVPRKRPRGRPRKVDVARDAELAVEVEERLAANGLDTRNSVRLAA